MAKTKTVLVSDQNEAVEKARRAFNGDSDLEWVIAEGNATVGGAAFESQGALVLHCSERGMWIGRHSVEACQETILATVK